MERVIRYIWVIALLGAMPAYFGCAQKSARLQQGVAPPDRTLFESGEDYLKRGLYVSARMAYQTMLNTYPDSDMALDAYFAIGDTFYEEGGTENLLQAENRYKDFIIFAGPDDPRSPIAQMKIISLNHGMMRSPDRDQQYAYRTLEEIETFLRRYPTDDFVPIVQQYRIKVEDNLARGDLGIGEFYLKQRGNPLGAISRFQYVTENYKNFEEMDTVFYRIGELLDMVGSPESAAWYSKIAEEYPFSRHYEGAKKRLTALGQEIPEVNEALAAANQAKIRPKEGFSPLRPMIDFAKALGFIAAADLYETAQRTLEEEKAQAAAKAGAGAGAGDDIQIESEIRRSASGGAPAGETPTPSAGSDGSDESPESTPASDDGPDAPDGPEQQRKPARYQRKP